ncbi:MAG TPA: hypothetical protein VGM06_10605 [Polyangiaceae bacterium]
MAGAALDLDDVVAADDRPGDAGIAPRAEDDVALRVRVLEEARALALGELEVRAGDLRELVGVCLRERRDHEPHAARALVHRLEKRQEGGLDGDLARLVRLGPLDPPVLEVPRLEHVDLLIVEVDVRPVEHPKLSGAKVRVYGDRVDLAPLGGD